MGATRTRAAFVGRTDELQQLQAAAERASDGQGVVILCGGEAGIGKTRLVGEFTRIVRDGGGLVIAGGCVELGGGGLPFGPFAEALRTAVHDGSFEAADVHAWTTDELAVLVPDLRRADQGAPGARTPDGPDDRGLGQMPLFEAILAALESIRRRGPLALVVEDLHWADRSTLDLITFLSRNVRAARLLVVVTIRTDSVRPEPVAAVLSEVTRRPDVQRLDLRRLHLAETTAYLDSLLGGPPDPALAARIHERSGGNPFFIEQLALAHLDGETTTLPPSLRDVLLSQLSRLPPTVQDLLAAAAIAGPIADETMLAAMLDVPEGIVLERLRIAVAERVLVPVPDSAGAGYGFHHALLAEAAEVDLLDAERRRLHARCADALLARPPRGGADRAQWTARIAHHRDRSGDRLGTVSASIEAALAAEDVAAHADAMQRYRRALDLLEPGEPVPHADWDRAELSFRAGVSAAHAGDPSAAAALLRDALEVLPADADPFRRGRMLVRLSEFLWTSADDDFVDALAAAAAVVPAEPPTSLRADALVCLGFHHQHRDDRDAARAAWTEARATAMAIDDAPREWALAAVCLGVLDYEDGDSAEGAARLDEALEALRRAGTRGDASAAWMDLVSVMGWAGSDERAVAIADEAFERSKATGYEAYYGSGAASAGAEALLSLGRPREALAMLDRVQEVSRGGYLDTVFAVTRAAALAAAGEVDTARDELAILGPLDEHGDVSIVRYRAAIEAEVAMEAADPVAVAQAARLGLALPATHIADVDQRGAMTWCACRAAADRAESARARRDTSVPRAMREEATDLIAALDAAITTSPPASPATTRAHAYRALAVAEAARLDGTSDPVAWHAAAEAWSGQSLQLRPLYARIREGEALILGDRHDRAGATARLTAAFLEATDRGALPLARMAADIARRARIALPDTVAATEDDARTDPAEARGGAAAAYGLTAREVEILGLLAAGLTNRQIGERLYISPKTAGVHVSNILGKLGVASRIQAATLAQRLGMDAPLDPG